MLLSDADPMIFAPHPAEPLGERVAKRLGLTLARHEERTFEDGEHKSRSLDNVRGRDVYVVQSLVGDTLFSGDEKLVRLLFFIGALKDASAGRVSVVAPYLPFLRKDQKTKPRDPVTTRYLAQLFEAMGTDRVITLEAHNPAAFQNAFRCRSDHLDARNLLVKACIEVIGDHEAAVVSPDPGGAKRAELFRERLEEALARPVGKGLCDKHRSGGVVSGDLFVGDVEGRTVVIIDDMIATGGTLVRAAKACRKAGARRIIACATHGLFVKTTPELFDPALVERVIVTDSVPQGTLADLDGRRRIVEIDGLLAAAIRCCHDGSSIVDLLAAPPASVAGSLASSAAAAMAR